LSNVDRSVAFNNSWRDGSGVEGSGIVMDVFRRVIGDGLVVALNLLSKDGEEGAAGADGDSVDDAAIVFDFKFSNKKVRWDDALFAVREMDADPCAV